MKTFEKFITEAKPVAPAAAVKYCCNDFKKATQDGTDSEGYGPAITLESNDPAKSTIGSVSKRIKFCPWCGTQLKK